MNEHKKILSEAKRRYDDAYKHWNHFQNESTELFDFIRGNQWTEITRQNFENQGYAAITSNRIPTYLRQITNELMKNTPVIQIDPRNDEDKAKAELLNDLVRNIQEESNAQNAYCKAAEHAASIGIGYFRIITKYKDENSFEQEFVFEPIEDPNTVMLDPNHTGLSGQDCEYAFITTKLTVEEYHRKYGKSKLSRKLRGDMDDALLKEVGDASWSRSEKKWTQDNEVLIAEYYFKEYKPSTLYQVMRDGEVITTELILETDEILQEREIMKPVVKWCKLNDMEVLEETEWPGTFIPIIPVKADEYWISGKRELVGAVEPAVEAQIELNYTKSYRGMLLQSAPIAPWTYTPEQIRGFEHIWENANVAKFSGLPYNHVEGVPPPTRQTSEAPIQAASLMVEGAEEALKAIFGTFDPSNTTIAPESGKAILARQHQSFNSNYHFYNNLAMSIKHAGCIILEAIPVIYDTPRTVALSAIDGKKRYVSINQPNEQGVIEYDLRKGEYSVSIQTGPSFGTKRQEFAEAGMDLITAYPNAGPAVADLIVRSMDWPGADKIADSLEAIVPPQVLAARKADPKNAAAMVPSLQAQVAALTQQNQLLSQQAQKHTAEMDKAASDIKVEMMKDDTEKFKAELDNKLKLEQIKFEREQTQLEYIVKTEELRIKNEELALKKTLAAQKINNETHDKVVDHIDRMSGIDETETGIKGDLR